MMMNLNRKIPNKLKFSSSDENNYSNKIKRTVARKSTESPSSAGNFESQSEKNENKMSNASGFSN